MAIGKAKYGGGEAKKRSKLEDGGENTYRILPPFGLLADKGFWSQYRRVHWGYGVPNEKDAGKLWLRPFECVRETDRFKKNEVTQECDACLRYEDQKKAYDRSKVDLEREGKTPDQVKAALAPLAAWLKTFNSQGAHYMNVMNPAGEISQLPIPHKSKQALDLAFKELMAKKKIDPIDPDQGVWVKFTKIVDKRNPTDTIHQVSFVYDTRTVTDPSTGEKLEVPVLKKAPLTNEDLERMEQEAWELTKLFIKLKPAEIRRLVQSDGDPDVSVQIFNGAKDAEPTPETYSNGYRKEESPAPVEKPVTKKVEPRPEPQVTKAPEPAAVPEVVAEDDDNAEAILLAKLAALKQKKDAAKATTVVVKPTPLQVKNRDLEEAPPSYDQDEGADMNDADFAARIFDSAGK